MRSARSSLLFFLALAALTPSALAVEEASGTPKGLAGFDGIKAQLAAIERTQKDILAQKEEILEEIGRVRVWTRHSGG